LVSRPSFRLPGAKLLPEGIRLSDNPTSALLSAAYAGAERLLNRVRLVVLLLLAVGAVFYAARLPHALTMVNGAVLAPMVVWTVGQHFVFHRKQICPPWLATVNSVADITAVSALLFGYGLLGNPDLAVKSPIWIVYCAILAARPFTGSALGSAIATTAAVVQYAGVTAFFLATGRLRLWDSPLASAGMSGTSALDEGARLVLLAVTGAVATYATGWTDETLRRAIDALRGIEARFRSMFNHSAAGIALLETDGTILETNGALREFLGYEEKELEGASASSFSPPEDAESIRALTHDLGTGLRESASSELRFVRRDGHLTWGTLVLSRADADGGPKLIAIVQDVSERKRLEAELAHQAFHDSLTELANRALFRDRVEHALSRSNRQRDRVAVLFLDLDNFKTINDSYGHGEGDELLRSVAGRLKNATRGCDTVARLGGDEFAVLLENVRDDEDTIIVADRIKLALTEPFQVGRYAISINVSIGIARATEADGTEEILRNADVAMYSAKSRGKGRYAIFAPSMHAAVMDRMSTESDLREALRRGDFRLVYQPIVDLADSKIIGVEALLRWEHERRGLVPPSAFIPLAEETGLIVPLGKWVLHEACRQGSEWQREGVTPSPFTITVNLSSQQLSHPDLVRDIADALESSNFTPSHLVLEITESAILHDRVMTVERLQALKALGVRLAIDDFGTGYSSLSYLRLFPVDILKIDKSFVDGVAEDGNDAALARTIVALGDTLALRTIAEGVEDGKQRSVLHSLGCQFAQGYLFSHPLAPTDVAPILRQGTREGIANLDRLPLPRERALTPAG
jgi:diguanylate cyclase (GGDEF)-like protein/PAS domain S-box-containing protein